MNEFHTPRQVARQLQVGYRKIITWIRSGRLRAVNVSDSDRPRYRISTEAIRALLEGHVVDTPKALRRTQDKSLLRGIPHYA